MGGVTFYATGAATGASGAETVAGAGAEIVAGFAGSAATGAAIFGFWMVTFLVFWTVGAAVATGAVVTLFLLPFGRPRFAFGEEATGASVAT